MNRRQDFEDRATTPRCAPEAAEDYRHQALEALDSLLAGPLGGGLGARELEVHFPLIRAALRQIRSDLEQAWALRC